MGNDRLRIAVLNDNSELTNLITEGLIVAGFETTGAYLSTLGQDPSAPSVFLEYFRPQIAIVDVLFPDHGSWRQVTELLIKKDPALAFIFTATETERLKQVIGKLRNRFHLVKKPYYLSDIFRKVENIEHSFEKRPAGHFPTLMHTR